MRSPRSALLTGALTVALLGVAACSDDEPAPGAEDSPGTSATATTTPTTPTSAAPSATGSAAPSSTAFPGVTPASGTELTLDTTTLHAPEGFEQVEQITASSISAAGRGGQVQLIELEGASDVPLDVRVDSFLAGQDAGVRTERLDDVVIGEPGLPAARLQWRENGEVNQVVLTWRAGTSVSVYFRLDPGLLEREPDLVESVLASVAWVV